MRPIVSLFLIILAFPFISHSQSRELGIMVGVMGYRGDLDKNMYDTRFLEPGISAIYRRSYSNHWAFKAGLLYGHVKADDSKADDFYSQNRNLNFRSHIIELSGQFEFNFFPYQTANPNSTFSPYLLCGLSVFHFNPKTKINDDWIELQPLGTEGQGTDASNKNPYKRTNLAFTFGGGFKFKIGRRFGLTLESGVRQTYTDYLDDVSTVYADPKSILVEYGKTAALLSDRSLNQAPGGNIGRQRGDKQRRDFYVFTGVQLTYTLSKKYIDACQPFRIKLW
ncbi:MAG: DUF6089 family protein [Bacteroidia bacterium]